MEIRERTIPKTWVRALKAVIQNGEQHETKLNDHSSYTIECTEPIFSIIQEPHRDPISPKYKFNKNRLDDYSSEIVNGGNLDTGHPYTYGERLRCHGNECVDQLDMLVYKLNDHRDTRKAAFSIWLPARDTVNESVPCFIAGHMDIRHGFLRANAIFRSHDMFEAFYANAYMLSKLQEYVAKRTSSKTGRITILSLTPHIYLPDLPEAEKIIGGIA